MFYKCLHVLQVSWVNEESNWLFSLLHFPYKHKYAGAKGRCSTLMKLHDMGRVFAFVVTWDLVFPLFRWSPMLYMEGVFRSCPCSHDHVAAG